MSCRVYLNNAATTWPKPPAVAEAMYRFMTHGGANLARGSASPGDLETMDQVLSCREELADLLGAPDGDPRYVTFTSNVTEALNVVLKGYLRPGMTVVTSSMEHNAVIRPLRRLEASGVTVRVVQCDAEGFLPLGDLGQALQGADLAVLCHGSNVCGTLQDLEAISEACRLRGVPLVLDSAQTAGVEPISVEDLGLGALCFTGHKGLMGPQGVGGIVWNPHMAEACSPLVDGGTGSFSHEEVQPNVMPDKFEAGTPNLPGIVGLRAALGWIREVGIQGIREREMALKGILLEGLSQIKGVQILGPRDSRRSLGVVALNHPSVDNGTLAMELSERGIETRPGLHCAPLAHRTLGTFPQGALRLSVGYFNTEEEVRMAVGAIQEVLRSHM
ncbi:aminotransferase class V-fold PLP-dependent enzyme [Thermanaerovibrio acidaminovorans]|jgi:cysteine desulfurase family protein|uniref:aminotransferase class V-fold PLP-dependent enzyme n=1 Tax=Thermanaerovibrio acidaminovorans TaxID=81462 RepID=UPI002491E643|nr:aminotransferase class V-fold PLP-dependent enzyme [Thermanaerovibrio acidaminovorans]